MVDSNPSRRAAAERAAAIARGESPPEKTPRERKKRTNLTDADFLVLFKACNRLKDEFKPGSKMQFWNDVQAALMEQNGKHIVQPKFPIEKKAEDRRAFVSDPDSAKDVWHDVELAVTIDIFNTWMDAYLLANPEASNGLPRRSESQRASSRPSESRIIPPPPPAFGRTQTPDTRSGNMVPPVSTTSRRTSSYVTPYAPSATNKRGRDEDDAAKSPDGPPGTSGTTRARASTSKRLRQSETEAPQRVVVEGALSKQDWIEIMGHNTRLTVLEEKLNTLVEMTKRTHQMLLQLAKNNHVNKGGSGATVLGESATGSGLANGL